MARPRLIEALDQLAHRKLALVSAPAGCGKTTVLAEWAHQTVLPVAWLSLDDGDNDLARFLAYLVAAWETIEPGIRDGPLGILAGSLAPPIDTLLSTLLNEAAARPAPFALALDDYHLIDEPAIHDALIFILDHLPSQMHLVLASRADPPLPLARLRARDQLVELRAEDLRFTMEEAARFLTPVRGIDLSADEVAALASRTEGWAAGLQLAALSMRGRDGPRGRLEAVSGADRYIADYLAGEVLAEQPEQVRTFLLQTSILDRLCGALCDAVTGRSDSQRMLEYLEQANLFLVPWDRERQWYRYHQLFAEFLRRELEKTPAGEVASLHRRASAWYAEHDLPDAAFRHALAGQDFDRAAQVVEHHFILELAYGQYRTVAEWLQALPAELFTARPLLGLCRAMFLLMGGQLGASAECLDDLERRLDSEDATQARDHLAHLARIAAARTVLACHQNDLERAIAFASQAFATLPENDLFYRFAAHIALGDTYRRHGQWAAAREPYHEALKVARQAPVPFVALHPLSALGDLYVMRGRLRRAGEYRRETLRLIADPTYRAGIPLPMMGWAYVLMGELLYEWNDLPAALEHLEQGLELAQLGGDTRALVSVHLTLGRVRLAQGDLAGALEQLRRAEPLVHGAEMPEWTDQFDSFQVQLWLARGDLRTAIEWVDETPFGVDDEASYRYEVARLALARVLIAQGAAEAASGTLDRALVLLNRLLHSAEATGRAGVVVEVLALKALVYRALRDLAQAMVVLERALRLAEPEGYVRVFVDLGPPMAALLQEALSRAVAPEYVRTLLAAFGAEPPGTSAATPRLVEPLSERELEVLRLVAAGLSNREIADTLVVAEGTVKKHVANIYQKLAVSSRTQAVTTARALRLLS